jgi:hypothetical protein
MLQRFESSSPHHPEQNLREGETLSGVAFSYKRTVLPCPHSSLAEHFFGKEEVLGPIPSGGWIIPNMCFFARNAG